MCVNFTANSMVDILSDALQTMEGINYISANTPVVFTSHSPIGVVIPPDTAYTWHVIETSSSEGVNSTSTATTLPYTFTNWGRYLLSVMGRTNIGATFVGQLDITVECESRTVFCVYNVVL